MLTRWEVIDKEIREALTEAEYKDWLAYLDKVGQAIRGLEYFRMSFAEMGEFQFKQAWLHRLLVKGIGTARMKAALCLRKFYLGPKKGNVPKKYRKYFRELGIKKFWN